MDTVTFVATPAISNSIIFLFAMISLICYLTIYIIANKAFYGYKPAVYFITTFLGLGLSIIINFIVYTVLI